MRGSPENNHQNISRPVFFIQQIQDENAPKSHLSLMKIPVQACSSPSQASSSIKSQTQLSSRQQTVLGQQHQNYVTKISLKTQPFQSQLGSANIPAGSPCRKPKQQQHFTEDRFCPSSMSPRSPQSNASTIQFDYSSQHSLAAVVCDLEADKRALESKLGHLLSENKELRSAQANIEQLLEQNGKASDIVEAQTTEIAGLRKMVQEKEERLSALEAALEERQALLVQASQVIKENQRINTTNMRKNEAMWKKKDEKKEKDYQQLLQQQLGVLREQCEEWHGKYINSEAVVQSKVNEINMLKGQLRVQVEEAESLQKQLNLKHAIVESDALQKQQLKVEIEKLNMSSQSQIQLSQQQALAQAEEFRGKLNQITGELSKKQQENIELTRRIAEQIEKQTQLQEKLDACDYQKEGIREELRSLQATQEQQHASVILERQSEAAEWMQQLEKANRELTMLKEENQINSEKESERILEIQQLNEKIEQQQQEIEEYQEECQALKDKMKELEIANQEIAAEMEGIQSEIAKHCSGRQSVKNGKQEEILGNNHVIDEGSQNHKANQTEEIIKQAECSGDVRKDMQGQLKDQDNRRDQTAGNAVREHEEITNQADNNEREQELQKVVQQREREICELRVQHDSTLFQFNQLSSILLQLRSEKSESNHKMQLLSGQIDLLKASILTRSSFQSQALQQMHRTQHTLQEEVRDYDKDNHNNCPWGNDFLEGSNVNDTAFLPSEEDTTNVHAKGDLSSSQKDKGKFENSSCFSVVSGSFTFKRKSSRDQVESEFGKLAPVSMCQRGSQLQEQQ